jgi:hypothetical protein
MISFVLISIPCYDQNYFIYIYFYAYIDIEKCVQNICIKIIMYVISDKKNK